MTMTNSSTRRRFAADLRDQLVDEIHARGWDEQRVADETGLLVEGVRTLISRSSWDMDSAQVIAAGLGIRIVPRLERDEPQALRT